MANTNKVITEKPLVTPKGIAHWAKVNSRYDEYEGKRKYMLDVSFDKATEATMKKTCDDLLEQAKGFAEFNGKEWIDDETRGYKTQEDGTLLFHFWTYAFYTDKKTGEEVQKVIPVLNAATRKVMSKDESIGNGSEVRISYTPSAYWSSKKSNGVSLYLNKIVVDKLVEFNGGSSFDEFGIAPASDADGFADVTGADEEVPI